MPQAWSVEVELATTEVTDDAIDELHDHLADRSPAVGTAPNGNTAVRIFVEAGTARQAVDSALKEVTAAAKAAGISTTVLGVDLVTEEELDRRLAAPSVPDLVGVSEIAEMLNVVRQRAAQLVQRDDFPPAVAHLKSGPVFVRWQVEAFEKRWDRRAGRPMKRVELTPVERDVLAALSAASRQAQEVLDPRSLIDLDALSGEGVAGGELIKGWLIGPVAGAADFRHLCAAYPADDTEGATALKQLVRKRLVAVEEESQQDDKVVVELELTSKGERVAAQ
ncbi:hypothetical protein [Streptomyces sp. t39]|uniref:hypothetical protein n=1 Tax=Streptomyces sp. t39 TaxID=1828156 RepID=UPI0011CD5195|nr:hypothetical protein [Streptomyces sp. t39]TXS50132.1 hypothetical protein EAO77_27880 [Streptomyces sp. t39]